MDGDENQHVQFFVMKQKSWNDDLKKERDMSMKSPNSTENKCAVKEVEVVAIEANIRDEKLGVYVPKEEAQDFNEVYNSFFYFAVLLHLLVFSLALPFLSKSIQRQGCIHQEVDISADFPKGFSPDGTFLFSNFIDKLCGCTTSWK